MNHDNYDDSYIRGILNTVKTIAMVGASAKDNRPSYFAFKYLLERGYNMIPINPGLAGKQLLGKTIYGKLSEVPEPIDMVDIFRAANYAMPVVQEALDAEAEAARHLDAAQRPQRRGGRARRGQRHEGGDEPLPQDRIRPALLRDRLDGHQLAHARPRNAPRCSAAACSACRSTARRSPADRPTRPTAPPGRAASSRAGVVTRRSRTSCRRLSRTVDAFRPVQCATSPP